MNELETIIARIDKLRASGSRGSMLIPECDTLLKKIQEYENCIIAVEFHGCLTGDCPHITRGDCYKELMKIPEMIDELTPIRKAQ